MKRWFWVLGILAALGCGSGSSTFPPGQGQDAAVSGASGSSVGGSSGSGPLTGSDQDAFLTQPDSPQQGLCIDGLPGDCVHTCVGNATTTISGTVYDPAGQNPLYGVVVYVPQSTPTPITLGASCYSCSDLYTGNPIAYAVTDSAGHFSIQGVPDGLNVPLVVQVGKWRMQYTVPVVTACLDTDALTATATIAIPQVLRLPKNHLEGDIPNIAIATGGADSLECLLHRVGVDETEYGPGPNVGGRISIYQGDEGSNSAPPGPVASTSMWATQQDLMPYDMVILTCEGHETTGMNQQALFNYAQAGGRAFASHFHYAWFNTGPFAAENLATWTTGSNQIGNINADILTTLPGGAAPFPRGVAMDQWLGNVGALTATGELPIVEARHNADVGVANTNSVPWIVADQDASAPGATEYFSFDTPFNTTPACGRVVFSDLHVGAASDDYGGNWTTVPAGSIVPTGCANNALSPQEKALEFMLFDLSACITPDDAGAGGLPPPPIPR